MKVTTDRGPLRCHPEVTISNGKGKIKLEGIQQILCSIRAINGFLEAFADGEEGKVTSAWKSTESDRRTLTVEYDCLGLLLETDKGRFFTDYPPTAMVLRKKLMRFMGSLHW